MNAHLDQAPSSATSRGFLVGRRAGLALPAVAVLLVALLAGCQALPAVQPTPTAAATPTPPTATPPTATPPPATPPTATPIEPTVAPGLPPQSYPLQLEDDEGTVVTIELRPERVISLTPATTELMFALGAGDRLVGRGEYDDYPPEATQLPAVAAFTGVNHEALVGLEPDLVLAGGNNFTAADDVERMRELGIPVLVLYAPTVQRVIDDILLVGEAIDAPNEANAIAAAMSARIGEVTAAVASLSRPRVFYQIGSEPEIYAPAPGSFVADMVNIAGGEPITTGNPAVFAISVERLVADDPQVIVLGDAQWGVCPNDVASRPGWQTMTAVREGAIRPVNDTLVTRPGPRLAEGLAALALAIHPTADIAPPEDDVELCAE